VAKIVYIREPDEPGTSRRLVRSEVQAPTRRKPMWKKPKIVEIPVGMEINSYACAELD